MRAIKIEDKAYDEIYKLSLGSDLHMSEIASRLIEIGLKHTTVINEQITVKRIVFDKNSED